MSIWGWVAVGTAGYILFVVLITWAVARMAKRYPEIGDE